MGGGGEIWNPKGTVFLWDNKSNQLYTCQEQFFFFLSSVMEWKEKICLGGRVLLVTGGSTWLKEGGYPPNFS